MTKLQKIVFFGFLLIVGAMIYAEATRPHPINWFPSYSATDKIPLGSYVFHDLLKEKFGDNMMEQNRPPFEILLDTALVGTYFFVNDRLYFDDTEVDRLLDWVGRGNTLFLSANYHSPGLIDSLSLEVTDGLLFTELGTEPFFELVNENLKTNKPYHIKRNFPVRHFREVDTLSHVALGVVEAFQDTTVLKEPKINFLKAPIGDGTIFFHNQPEVFSNYFLLEEEENLSYTEGVLSYLDQNEPLLWDNHYKSGKPIQVSPLYILLNNERLKWSYYFLLIGVFIFVLFEGKRKQRSIPIVTPLSNKTFEYTQTIAGMYLEKNEHHSIAQKQITLFMEYIRTKLRIPTEKVDVRFMKAVAARSGNTFEDTKDLFTFIEKIQHQHETSPDELVKLNIELTKYKKKIDGKS